MKIQTIINEGLIWLEQNCAGLVLLVGFAICFISSNNYVLIADDGIHWDIATQATLAKTIKYSADQVHPPLFFIVLRYWIKIFHDSPYSMRLLSELLYAIACSILVKWMGVFSNKHIAALGGLLLLSSSYGWDVASQIRGYSLMLVFIASALYSFEKSTKSLFYISCWAFSSILALATHYSAIFAIAPMGLLLLIRWIRSDKFELKIIYFLCLAALLAFISLLYLYDLRPYILKQHTLVKFYLAHWRYDSATTESYFTFLIRVLDQTISSFFITPPNNLTLHIATILLITLGSYCQSQVNYNQHRGTLMKCILLFGPLTLVIIASLAGKYPISPTRHSFFLFPFAIYLMADALYYLIKYFKIVGYLAIITFFAALVFNWSAHSFTRRPWQVASSNATIINPILTLLDTIPEGDILFADVGMKRLFPYYLNQLSERKEEAKIREKQLRFLKDWDLRSFNLCQYIRDVTSIADSNFKDFWILSFAPNDFNSSKSLQIIKQMQENGIILSFINLATIPTFLHVKVSTGSTENVCNKDFLQNNQSANIKS